MLFLIFQKTLRIINTDFYEQTLSSNWKAVHYFSIRRIVVFVTSLILKKSVFIVFSKGFYFIKKLKKRF